MCTTSVGFAVSITTPPIAIQNGKLARIEMAALCATFVQKQMLYDGWVALVCLVGKAHAQH